MKKYAYQYKENINKNIFNNLLINVSHRTHTLIFQKLLSHLTAPAPEPKSAPVLPRHQCIVVRTQGTKPPIKRMYGRKSKKKTAQLMTL